MLGGEIRIRRGLCNIGVHTLSDASEVQDHDLLDADFSDLCRHPLSITKNF